MSAYSLDRATLADVGGWGQARGVLREQKSAADDSPATGKGQERMGPGRKESCLGRTDKSPKLISGS